MGGSSAVDSRRLELPAPHRPRRGTATLRLATSLLDVSLEAGEEPPLVDNPGAARSSGWPIPLVESATQCPGTLSSANFSGRRQHRRWQRIGSKATGQCGAFAA